MGVSGHARACKRAGVRGCDGNDDRSRQLEWAKARGMGAQRMPGALGRGRSKRAERRPKTWLGDAARRGREAAISGELIDDGAGHDTVIQMCMQLLRKAMSMLGCSNVRSGCCGCGRAIADGSEFKVQRRSEPRAAEMTGTKGKQALLTSVTGSYSGRRGVQWRHQNQRWRAVVPRKKMASPGLM